MHKLTLHIFGRSLCYSIHFCQRSVLNCSEAALQLHVPNNIPNDSVTVNPLTTANECTHHATLGVSYQLAQSVWKIGFALAKKVG